MAKKVFAVWKGTLAAYKALATKSADTLYYTTPTADSELGGRCYLGDQNVGVQFKSVANFLDETVESEKAQLETGIIYLGPAAEARYWDGTSYKVICKPLVTSISSSTVMNEQVPTVGAVYASEQTIYTYVNTIATGLGRLLPAVQTLTELKAKTGMQDKDLILVEDVGSLYRFDADSTDSIDNDKVLLPDSVNMVETTDTTAQAGKTYFKKSGYTYTKLVAGEDYAIGDPVGTDWYEEVRIWTKTTDTVAKSNKTYYKKSGDTYTKLIAGTDYTPGVTVPGDDWYEGSATGRWIKMYTTVNLSSGNGITISDGKVHVNADSNYFEFTGTGSDVKLSFKSDAFLQPVSTASSGHVVIFDSNGQLKDNGIIYSVDSTMPTTPGSKTLANQVQVMDAISSAVSGFEPTNKLDKFTGTDGNLVTVSSGGSAVGDGKVGFTTSTTLPADPSSKTLANERQVFNAVSGKLDIFTGSTGNVVLVDSDGNAVKDGSKAIGSSELSTNSTTRSSLLATEAAVWSAVDSAVIYWTEV